MPKLHRSVERLGLRALVQHAEGIQHVRAEHAVHQEPGSVLHRQRQLVDLPHERRGLSRELGVRLFTADHFDELQQRHRVEKMDSHEPRRVLERGGDVGELEARGVGRQDRAGLRQRLQLCEQRALRLQVLEDRLDQHVGLARAIARHVRDQAIERVALARLVAQPPLEQLRGALHRRGDALGRGVLQRDAQAAHRADRRDVAAHHAGADHVHVARLDPRPCPVTNRSWRKKMRTRLQLVDADQF
jgi:hypothetical protein